MRWNRARRRRRAAVGLERALFALTLVLMVVSAPQGPAAAQVVSAAHEDAEWENDRQSPYDGEGWLESQGGSPALSFPSSGVALRSWISLTDFDAAAPVEQVKQATVGFSD